MAPLNSKISRVGADMGTACARRDADPTRGSWGGHHPEVCQTQKHAHSIFPSIQIVLMKLDRNPLLQEALSKNNMYPRHSKKKSPLQVKGFRVWNKVFKTYCFQRQSGFQLARRKFNPRGTEITLKVNDHKMDNHAPNSVAVVL